MDLGVFLIFGANLSGGLIFAGISWLDSGEKWSWQKFSGTLKVSLLSAAAFAIGYQVVGKVESKDILIALQSGLVIAFGANKIPGAVSAVNANGKQPI